ncbi:hypothetical protein MES4922_610008 [Mesorhizobium ventifaucium]|uniref:Uncharacterized protein n=1 Tax=Mesorhizobium ventifaucium TaxID=666020 RepID=A0ABN8KCM6_9HYPH|nr:hypothetical protein MES4922_610008 [Mesorhizobium ventifaucium]
MRAPTLKGVTANSEQGYPCGRVIRHRRSTPFGGSRRDRRNLDLSSGGYTGTIIGALILTVLTTLLTILQMPEGAWRILFGLIVFVTAAYLRIIEDR